MAILVAHGFEQLELTEPRKALDAAGAETIYGIFDTFPDHTGQQAYLSGRVARHCRRVAPSCWRSPR